MGGAILFGCVALTPLFAIQALLLRIPKVTITIYYMDNTTETFTNVTGYSTGAASITFYGAASTGVEQAWEIPLVSIRKIGKIN